jgi:hypothetical protein
MPRGMPYNVARPPCDGGSMLHRAGIAMCRIVLLRQAADPVACNVLKVLCIALLELSNTAPRGCSTKTALHDAVNASYDAGLGLHNVSPALCNIDSMLCNIEARGRGLPLEAVRIWDGRPIGHGLREPLARIYSLIFGYRSITAARVSSVQ